MSYKERVDRVIDFIGKYLDEELELDEICRIACFSKYHFHHFHHWLPQSGEELGDLP